MIQWWQGIILGIIQGATEFLPVSSSGHLAVVQNLFKNFHQPGVLFDLLLHLATALAVVIYFKKELVGLFGRRQREKLMKNAEKLKPINKKLILVIFVSLLPTAIVGFSVKDIAEKCFEKPFAVGLFLIFTALLLFLADFSAKRSSLQVEADPGFGRGILIGLAQGLAVFPGISRSGATISAGIFSGLRGDYSARFSFLLGVPAILGASFLELIEKRNELAGIAESELSAYLLGMVSAFLVGYFCISLVFKVVRRVKLSWFGIYCLFLGAIVILTFWQGF